MRLTFIIFFGIVMVIVILTFSCTQKETITFRDITKQTGIDFRYTFGDSTYGNILESSGSGVTIFDYDGDEDMDLYLLNGSYLEGVSDPKGGTFTNASNKLYRNNSDGTFTDVSKKAGVDDRHWSMAAGSLDYDGDGDIDLYLVNYGPNIFYLNNGDGTFTDITDSLGLRGPEKLNGFTKWSVSIAFWDYNRDGAVDLMVGNFLAFDPSIHSSSMPPLMPHPSQYLGQPSMLYKQESDGRFTEVTKELGLFYPDSKCMGLTVFDYDDDGDMDLFQANDHQSNFLFRNDGNGKFKETAVASGVAVNDRGMPTGSMHGSIGDIDGDGLIDLLVTDLSHGALYRNLGDGLFEDITENSGIANVFGGKGAWAAALFDYDNDGDLDIFSANGVAEELIEQLPLLLENNGKGHFQNIGLERSSYFNEKRSGRGAAIWDFDNDGDLDIIVNHVDLKGTATLLRNDGGNSNHWLGLNLVGSNGPASAIGAKVTVKIGDTRQVVVNQWATGYLSYSDPRIHIGLGNHDKVDSIEIMWSDGQKENYQDLGIDHYVTIRQGAGI